MRQPARGCILFGVALRTFTGWGTLLVVMFVLAGASSGEAQRVPATAAQVDCVDDPLGPITDGWVLAIHGDLAQQNTDSEGRIAVGGDATLSSFGVGSALPRDPARVDLAVGGTLNAFNASAINGSITYGESLNGSAFATQGGTVTQRPLDLDALFQEAQRRADLWAALAQTGTIGGPANGALDFDGDDPQLNVFTVTAERLEQARELRFRVPFGSSILVNVRGATYTALPYGTTVQFWDGSKYVQPNTDDSQQAQELDDLRQAMLWNFSATTALTIGPGAKWQGTILAPGAAVRFDNGEINGSTIAGALSGTGETHLHLPTGLCLPPPGDTPPEPPPDPPDPPEPPTPPDPTPPAPPTPPEPPPPEPPAPGTPPAPEIPPFQASSQSEQQESASSSGALPGAADRSDFGVEKQVLSRRGRPVALRTVLPGQLVRFRLHGFNLGFVPVRGVVACDRVPAGLQLVRARGGATFRDGRLCWRLGTVETQRETVVTFRVRRSVCGRVVNELEVRSTNGGTARDRASVSACRPAPPRLTG